MNPRLYGGIADSPIGCGDNRIVRETQARKHEGRKNLDPFRRFAIAKTPHGLCLTRPCPSNQIILVRVRIPDNPLGLPSRLPRIQTQPVLVRDGVCQKPIYPIMDWPASFSDPSPLTYI
jgi:hypothetical protein